MDPIAISTAASGRQNNTHNPKEGRGDETAAAYVATVLSFPHYWVLSPLSGTPQTGLTAKAEAW
jgi:hypothetical protein